MIERPISKYPCQDDLSKVLALTFQYDTNMNVGIKKHDKNRFVLLVYVKCSRNCYFNCNDRAGFPDMNYETLDQILWKCHHVVPNSSWYIHWRRLKLSNRHLNIYGLYKEACDEKKKHHKWWNQQSHRYHMIPLTCTVLSLSGEAKEFWM